MYRWCRGRVGGWREGEAVKSLLDVGDEHVCYGGTLTVYSISGLLSLTQNDIRHAMHCRFRLCVGISLNLFYTTLLSAAILVCWPASMDALCNICPMADALRVAVASYSCSRHRPSFCRQLWGLKPYPIQLVLLVQSRLSNVWPRY